MDTIALVRLIEGNTQQLISGLYAELKTNLGTSHYRRLSDEEIRRRGTAVFQGLTEWLPSRNDLLLEGYGEEFGKRRFTEGVPLGQVVLALILIEKHLWAFLDASAQQVETGVRSAVTEYFQKATYYTAKGYEAALAVSNRLAKRAAGTEPVSEPPTPKQPPKKEPAKAEHELEISRGGEVGEFGG